MKKPQTKEQQDKKTKKQNNYYEHGQNFRFRF
jgi:hypothetical protein